MHIKIFLLAITLLGPNLLHAQNDDFDEQEEVQPSLYKVVKNDRGLSGLMRTADDKLIIPYKYNEINLSGTPGSVETIYVNIVDSLNNTGIYSIKENRVIVPCKYKDVKMEYNDFYPNDDKEIYQFCGFTTESIKDNENTNYLFSPSGKLLLATKFTIHITPMGKYQTDTIICYLEDETHQSNNSRFSEDTKVGYLLYSSKSGNIIQQKEFKSIESTCASKLLTVENNDKKYGVINCVTGKNIIENQYDSIVSPMYSCFIVYKNKRVALFDSQGNLIVPEGTYDKINNAGWARYDKENPLALCVSKNNKWGCINDKNKIILPLEFDYEFEYMDTIWVSKNNKWGCISSKGLEVIPFEYEAIVRNSYENSDTFFDYISVEKNNKWGCLKMNGKIIVPIEYEKPIVYYDTMWVSKNGKWGCINKDMKQLIDFKFDTTIYKNFWYRDNTASSMFEIYGKQRQLNKNGILVNRNDDINRLAVNNDSIEVRLYMINANTVENTKALEGAIWNYRIEEFFMIINQNPKIDSENSTLLYNLSSKCGGTDSKVLLKMFNALIKAGIDPKKQNRRDLIVSYFQCSEKPDIEFVKALIAAGFKVTTKALYGGDDVFDYKKKTSDELRKLLKEQAKLEL
jgi:hypothetical protein